MRYQDRLCVPDVDGLRERILTEHHESRYMVHLGFTKMYHILKKIYWWNNKKRDMETFITMSIVCQ